MLIWSVSLPGKNSFSTARVQKEVGAWRVVLGPAKTDCDVLWVQLVDKETLRLALMASNHNK